jgi:type III secretory pathway component EscS
MHTPRGEATMNEKVECIKLLAAATAVIVDVAIIIIIAVCDTLIQKEKDTLKFKIAICLLSSVHSHVQFWMKYKFSIYQQISLSKTISP